MNDLFKIYKLDHDEALRIAETVNPPHQHDFEELIIGLKGGIEHFIDFKTTTYNAPFISFVTKGKIHRAQPKLYNQECDFWVIRFKSEFIPDVTFKLYNYYHDQATFSLNSAEQLDRLDKLCKLIQEEMRRISQNLGTVKSLLSALFSMIEELRQQQFDKSNKLLTNQNKTFQSFLAILEENFRRNEGVNFYADKLFTSSKTLNTITQNILNLSVSEIIETRKLTEAKNLLFTTDLTIAEIGYEIGYSDKAYFTSVFKKKSGQTPSEFRVVMKGLLS